ncbi:MAG: hypothetical protein ACODAG_10685 [Myxococcota bacterium]
MSTVDLVELSVGLDDAIRRAAAMCEAGSEPTDTTSPPVAGAPAHRPCITAPPRPRGR